MYDGNKIIPGLVIFVGLMTFPLWYNFGDAGPVPNPQKVENGASKCVRDTQYMRTSHMQLLDDWRDEVVRDGDRTPLVIDGKKYDKSLMNSCMECHANKQKFCDECHVYTAVKPYCWDCHYLPKEKF